jgi:basic membrane protein A and related proteins
LFTLESGRREGRIMKRQFLIGLAAAMLSMAANAQEKLKIGFIYVGPVGDFGWSYPHDQGRTAIEAAFPGRMETTFIETVAEPTSDRVIEQLARTGHKLIFTASFGCIEPTLRVAARCPDVKFEHATGFKRAPNVATYSAKFHEGRYIAGQIAGKMTKTNTIGYVGAFPIAQVIAGINAFYLGAKSVNPHVEIKTVWVSSWFDPPKEADATKVLLDQGADVITKHTEPPAAGAGGGPVRQVRLRPGL